MFPHILFVWRVLYSCLLGILNMSNFFLMIQFSCSVMSNSFRPHELQHAKPPCPSPTPRIYSNSCPFSRWCHPTISSPVIPFSSCLQSFSASGSFLMSQFLKIKVWVKHFVKCISLLQKVDNVACLTFDNNWIYNPLIKVLAARLLHCKGYLFPFVINKSSWRPIHCSFHLKLQVYIFYIISKSPDMLNCYEHIVSYLY